MIRDSCSTLQFESACRGASSYRDMKDIVPAFAFVFTILLPRFTAD